VQIQEVGVHVGTPQDGISELRRWCGDGVGRRTVMEVDNFVQDKRLKAAGAPAISREINDLGKERRTEPSHVARAFDESFVCIKQVRLSRTLVAESPQSRSPAANRQGPGPAHLSFGGGHSL
jgi:hypothetical protein